MKLEDEGLLIWEYLTLDDLASIPAKMKAAMNHGSFENRTFIDESCFSIYFRSYKHIKRSLK